MIKIINLLLLAALSSITTASKVSSDDQLEISKLQEQIKNHEEKLRDLHKNVAPTKRKNYKHKSKIFYWKMLIICKKSTMQKMNSQLAKPQEIETEPGERILKSTESVEFLPLPYGITPNLWKLVLEFLDDPTLTSIRSLNKSCFEMIETRVIYLPIEAQGWEPLSRFDIKELQREVLKNFLKTGNASVSTIVFQDKYVLESEIQELECEINQERMNAGKKNYLFKNQKIIFYPQIGDEYFRYGYSVRAVEFKKLYLGSGIKR